MTANDHAVMEMFCGSASAIRALDAAAIDSSSGASDTCKIANDHKVFDNSSGYHMSHPDSRGMAEAEIA
jgi:hypothetical protein